MVTVAAWVGRGTAATSAPTRRRSPTSLEIVWLCMAVPPILMIMLYIFTTVNPLDLARDRFATGRPLFAMMISSP
jgi:hypothetical protein